MEEEGGIHELIQSATDQEMQDLLRHRAVDICEHTRRCSVCEVKREEHLERVLRKLTPERRALLERVARAVARKIATDTK